MGSGCLSDTYMSNHILLMKLVCLFCWSNATSSSCRRGPASALNAATSASACAYCSSVVTTCRQNATKDVNSVFKLGLHGIVPSRSSSTRPLCPQALESASEGVISVMRSNTINKKQLYPPLQNTWKCMVGISDSCR